MSSKKKNEPNKSDFVRSQPVELSAGEVVAKAKEAGLAISSVLVYTVRAKQKAKATKSPEAPKTSKTPKTPKASKAPETPKKGKRAKRGKKAKSSVAKAAPSSVKKAPGKLSASAFIRTLPVSLPAKEATEKGASEGYSFKVGLVYEVRAAMRKRAAKSGAAASTKPAPAHAPKPAASAHHSSSHRAQFRRLLIDLGLTQAEALYADVHRELKAIWNRD